MFAVSGVVLAVLLAMSAPAAQAAGLGEVQVASQLGERLYARVPLVGEGAADVAPECVQLIPESALQDAPALSNARVAIDRRSSPPAVVVSTAAPVMEPAVRFVLELGCGNRLRREFVLLIDPPDLPAVQTAGASAPLPPAARVLPREESRWGATSAAPAAAAAPVQSAAAQPQPLFDAPLTEPPVKAAPAPRKAAPKPRPKPAVKPAAKPATPQVAQAAPPSAPPPPVRAPEAPKPAGTDRLVLADADPAAPAAADQGAKDAAAEKAAKDAAREEALTRQIEALTKEVARMREDMDKLAARNRELAKEAENSRTGWFAAAGLGIALAGVGLGLLGRREKKKTWRENLSNAEHEADHPDVPLAAALPQVREEAPAAAPKAFAAAAAASAFHTTSSDISDLDITKIDVQESVGGGTLMPPPPLTTAASETTMFPSDLTAVTALAEEARTQMGPLKELDFSLDDFDLKVPTLTPKSPIFSPTTQVSPEESEAARAKLFEEIETVHRANKKN